MGEEIFTIEVRGTPYTAFKSIVVSSAIDEAAGKFEATIAAEYGPHATKAIFGGAPAVTVRATGDLLLTGYVDRYRPSLGSNTISISGRSKSQDAIDCSASHKTGRIEKKDPVEIAREVAGGINVEFETDQKLDKVEAYQLTPGETLFRTVEKLTRRQGCTITSTPEGKAKVTKAGTKRHAGALIEGVNIKVGDADHDMTNRHSDYTIRGQRAEGHGPGALEIEAKTKDSGVKRHRPVIIIAQDDINEKDAKSRVKNRRDRAAGEALTATVTTQGIRDEAGQIWTQGYLVWTESPFLGIAQDMLVKSVSLSQGDEGTLARLDLCDPRAFGGKKGKGNKSASSWEQGD